MEAFTASVGQLEAARQAIAPVVSSAPADVGALKTPSWSSIVEAYHKEGNGDRDMLLALLTAKAKEDERLAALDLLKAEQLRAYSTHIAVHGPLFPPVHPQERQPAQAYYAPTHKQRQHPHLDKLSMPNNQRPAHANANRSPSLSLSRASSADSEAGSIKTPVEERHPHHPAGASFYSHGKRLSTSSDEFRERAPLKRKRSSESADFSQQHPAPTATSPQKPVRSSPVSHKRASPYGSTKMLPGISSLVSAAASAASEAHPRHPSAYLSSPYNYPHHLPSTAAPVHYAAAAAVDTLPHSRSLSPPYMDRVSSQPRSPKSLRTTLHEELRPFAASRVATSDVRSSASEDDE